MLISVVRLQYVAYPLGGGGAVDKFSKYEVNSTVTTKMQYHAPRVSNLTFVRTLIVQNMAKQIRNYAI